MGMSITQKIISDHVGYAVKPGDLVMATVDLAFGNDITAPIAIHKLAEYGIAPKDPSKVALIPDHFAPNKDIASAIQCQTVRMFADKYNIEKYWDVGETGIEHTLLPEQGIITPGQIIVGADSHTCTHGALGAFAAGVGSTDLAFAIATGKAWFKVPETIRFVYSGKLPKWSGGKDIILYTIGKIGVSGALYKTMEFAGNTIRNLGMDDRLTICNMAVEAGAKNGIIEPDEITENYLKGRTDKKYKIYKSDADSASETIYIDAGKIEPQVAFPHLPENSKPISQITETIKIDQAFIGSCTNGRISDLRIAAEILKGRHIAKGVRLIVIPATKLIYREALKEGLFDIFLDAGAIVSTPTCGPCLGGHMGILAPGETAVSTSNRNFVGRMGSPESFVYLANAAIAAASAVAGHIISPEKL